MLNEKSKEKAQLVSTLMEVNSAEKISLKEYVLRFSYLFSGLHFWHFSKDPINCFAWIFFPADDWEWEIEDAEARGAEQAHRIAKLRYMSILIWDVYLTMIIINCVV